MSLFDNLILEVCLLHPVSFFLSDLLSDVIGVITKYVQTVLYPTAEEILPRHVSFLRQKIWDIFMIYPVLVGLLKLKILW